MKLHLTQAAGSQLITGYGDSWVEVNHARHDSSMIVLPATLVEHWPVKDFDSLASEHFEQLISLKPEVILLGTGPTHRFLHPRVSHTLIQAGISIECMTTVAACRTYNILMAEGRHVAAALII
ncbi:Mth938-like domain-containing protein [Methylobacillus gramineus]|uniref:Mth938-like domain-containing protein n=1 Tax=Methylobacillus gramineus TaxID=755169 RepID=UPI001CFF8DCB|nr:Mth938-like domain-containing protein [Methylobacillus gramineus]MCB5183869.1 Mth938-like domain-containing protein [Methylobacillus gramineus]